MALVLSPLQQRIADHFDANPRAVAIVKNKRGKTEVLVKQLINDLTTRTPLPEEVLITCATLEYASVCLRRVSMKLANDARFTIQSRQLSTTTVTLGIHGAQVTLRALGGNPNASRGHAQHVWIYVDDGCFLAPAMWTAIGAYQPPVLRVIGSPWTIGAPTFVESFALNQGDLPHLEAQWLANANASNPLPGVPSFVSYD